MRSYIVAIIFMIPLFLYSGQTSIYDIQYTNNTGTDGTYPSPLRNQTVTTNGIVTAINYRTGGYYLSEPEGGPWRGIYVNDRNRAIRVGDLVELTGEVYEHFGFTTLRNVRELKVISSNNPLPAPTAVTTGELAISEAYEGVLVLVTNVSVTGKTEEGDAWMINDGSGTSRLGDGFIPVNDRRFTITNGESFSQVTGIVDYRYGEYRVSPRTISDLQRSTVGVSKPSWGRIKSYYR